jgi:hypothetical protein
MTLGGSPPAPAAATTAETENKLELSFEYLVAADKLVWVRVVSSQAILMSLCLQSMVEELVRIRAGEKEPRRLTRCAAKPRSQVVQRVLSEPCMEICMADLCTDQ